MLFVKADQLKSGMRLAKPIYNKNGVMLYDRNSKLTSQGIVSIQNFGLIGVFILEAAEPLPPMTQDDIEFERFQAMSIFKIKAIMDDVSQQKEPKDMYPFANQIIKNYGNLYHKINFIQNLRSAEDYTYKHSLNTAILAALLSKKMKLEFKAQLDLVVAAIIYDIGNLLLPLSLRKKKKEELTPEDETKINTYHFAGYQILNKNYDLDPNVKRIAVNAIKKCYKLGEEENSNLQKMTEVQILCLAAEFDQMTAMNLEEEPVSSVRVLRSLREKENDYAPEIIQALEESIHILPPGVCVELNDGEYGLVIAEGAVDVLQPFILSFKDNQVINLADTVQFKDKYIVDIMKKMDRRHAVSSDLLAKYTGTIVHMGERQKSKHF